jgi:hypothetical protein
MDGAGVYSYADGSVYRGEWRRGRRHGRGRLAWAGGDVFEGGRAGGEMHGQGRLAGRGRAERVRGGVAPGEVGPVTCGGFVLAEGVADERRRGPWGQRPAPGDLFHQWTDLPLHAASNCDLPLHTVSNADLPRISEQQRRLPPGATIWPMLRQQHRGSTTAPCQRSLTTGQTQFYLPTQHGTTVCPLVHQH